MQTKQPTKIFAHYIFASLILSSKKSISYLFM